MSPALLFTLLQAPRPIRFDFEDGTLQGWRVVWGRFGELPSCNDNDRHGGNFGKHGRWFIGTCELGGGAFDDGMVGEIRSPTFVIHYDKIALLVGGGYKPKTAYVALCLADGGREVYRETGRNREMMDLRIWDVSRLKGKRAFIKVVDKARGPWGHINVDFVRELTPEEEARIVSEIAKREKKWRERYEEWRRGLFESRVRVYRGDVHKAVAFPLGGIGTGTLGIGADGRFKEWMIFNRVWRKAVMPATFLSAWARVEGGKPIARVLQMGGAMGLPGVREVELVGEYPVVALRYRDPELPVEVETVAFTPLIPLEVKDSALPAAVFVVSARNPNDRPADVSLSLSLQNAVGYDGFEPVDGLRCKFFGGNVNRLVKEGAMTAVHMASESVKPDSPTFGTMTLATTTSGATVKAFWGEPSDFWADFSEDGELEGEAKSPPSPQGSTWAGSVAVKFDLRPGERKEAAFILAWHFPNRFVDWDKRLANVRIGNMYSNWFSDSLGVARYVAENLGRLSRETMLFHDALYDSTLPYWLLDRVSANISIIRSPTCMWLEDGTLACFEGCAERHGCCPMNCTHVWNYEQTMAHLFPELERRMRRTDLEVQMDERGMVRHRLVVPINLPQTHGPATDGQLGTVLKVYREHLRSPDRRFLEEFWPLAKRAMDFVLEEWDGDGDGLIEAPQPCTYDCVLRGRNSFIGTLYLAALRAAEEMARLMGDEESARRYRERFERGREKLDSQLWNGEYYEQKLLDEITRHQYIKGCHSDQLFGQWWANVLGLGYILPPEHVREALRSIFRNNWRYHFHGFVQRPRRFVEEDEMGLVVCTWPHGGRPEEPTLYSDEAGWTGLEYELAALMIWEGMVEEAYHLIKAASDRYDGRRRNPWAEVECGDRYARAMSSWSLLLAAEGFEYDGPRGILKFAPKVTPENFRAFFVAAEGWGTLAQERRDERQVDKVIVRWGRLRLSELRLEAPEGAKVEAVEARLDDERVHVKWAQKDAEVSLLFEGGLEVAAPKALTIALAL